MKGTIIVTVQPTPLCKCVCQNPDLILLKANKFFRVNYGSHQSELRNTTSPSLTLFKVTFISIHYYMQEQK